MENKGERYMPFVRERASELAPEMKKNYAWFHEHPELGGEEFKTAQRVKEYLEEAGIEIIGEGIGGSGMVARVKGKGDGGIIALRADMDALPIFENGHNALRSQHEGLMHACGHDAHTAGLMGTGKILKELAERGDLSGDVLLLFQPNEEKAKNKKSGAVSMIKFLEQSGWRDKIKAFFGVHIFSQLERGEVQLADTVQMASSGMIDIKLESGGGHGSNIRNLPDLDFILSDIKLRLADMFEEYWQNDQAFIESMGPKMEVKADNVMPNKGGRTYVLRITDMGYKKISKDVLEKIKAVVQTAMDNNIRRAKSNSREKGATMKEENMEVKVAIKVSPNYRPVIHRDHELVDLAAKTSEQVLENFQWLNKGSMASDDFSFYLEKFRGKEIPGAYLLIGAANSSKGIGKTSHHTPDFQFDTDVIEDTAALYGALALNAIDYFKGREGNVI